MKIIVVTFEGNEGNKFTSGALNDKEIAWLSKADSTLLKGGKPYFLPDNGDEYRVRPYIVVRLSRLGKSIPARYAYRYLDGWTIGLNVWNESKRRRLEARKMPWDGAFDVDYSSILGSVVRMVPVPFSLSESERGGDGSTPFDGIEVSVQLQDDELSAFRELATLKLDGLMSLLCEEIEKLSKSMTIRQGDFLYACPLGEGFTLRLGQRIKAFSNTSLLLDTAVK